jgi:hypothetical protein
MASIKQQLEDAGYDTSSFDEATMLKKLDEAGYDVSGFSVTPPPPPNPAKNIAEASQMGNMLQTAAPSNMLKNLGVASANAPGVTMTALGSMLPGSNARDLIKGVQNVQANPNQIQNAAQRVAAVQGGAELSPEETVPALTGLGAGMAIEATGPNLFRGGKAEGPFSAGLSKPETALPGSLDDAQKALGKAKQVAFGGGLDPEQTKAVTQFRDIFASNSNSLIGRTAREGMKAIEEGKDLSPAQLVGYRAAFGRAQSAGGPFADEYAKGLQVIDKQLANKSPDLLKAIRNAALNYKASGGSEFTLPALTLAVDHGVGAVKTAVNLAKTGAIQNAAGAAVSVGSKGAAAGSDALLRAYDKYFNKKRK